MSDLVRFDWAIKYLLRNKANFDILEGFLSELLKMPITIQEILESESNKNHDRDKFNRVDILVKTSEGKKIIVELQCSRQWDYLSRVLYGASKVVCEYLKEGEDYHKIGKVISVSIVFFDLGEGKDYLYHGVTTFKGIHYHDTLNLSENEKKVYKSVDVLMAQTPETIFPEYYIIKVTKFKQRVQSKFDEWIYFLKHGKIKKEFKAKGIQSANKKLDVLKLNEKDRRAYERYQESLHDDASFNTMVKITVEEAREEARKEAEEARKEALKEALKEIAQSLKRAGLSDKEIAAHTHLSLKEIQNLKIERVPPSDRVARRKTEVSPILKRLSGSKKVS